MTGLHHPSEPLNLHELTRLQLHPPLAPKPLPRLCTPAPLLLLCTQAAAEGLYRWWR
jgi:hypothetical protein